MTQTSDRRNNRPSTRRRQERDSQLPPGRSVSRRPASDPEPRFTPLEAALTGIDDGLLVLDKDWRCTYVNKVAAAFLGSTPRESTGKVVWEVFPQARDSRLYEEFVRAVEQKAVVRFEDYHEPFGRWYEWRCYPADGGLTVLLRDTTGHRLMEQAARARQEWERTFDAVPDLITIIDRQHRILRANRAMAERLGTTPERCAGSLCYMCVHGLKAPPDLCPHAQVLADGREHMAEIYEERLGGYFLITCTPLLDPQGRVLGSVHVARDITERKRSEEALRESKETLRQLNEHLEAEVQARTEELRDLIDRLHGEVARRVDVESRLRERSQMLETFFQHTITPLVFMNWCFDFVRVNEAFAAAAGKEPRFFAGKNFFTLYPDKERKAIFERVVRTGQAYQAYAKPFRFAGDPRQNATHWNWWLTPLLAEERDIEIVGQAGNGREAIDLARELQPDVVVMDVAMPVMGGDEATRQIKQDLPDTRVVALSMFDDDRIAERMRRAGAATYLLKTAPSDELLAAIRGT